MAKNRRSQTAMELPYPNDVNCFSILKMFEPFEQCEPYYFAYYRLDEMTDGCQEITKVVVKVAEKANHSQEYGGFLPMECHRPEGKVSMNLLLCFLIAVKLYLIIHCT